MRWIRQLRLRVGSLLRNPTEERELNDEFQYHLEHLVDDYVSAGILRKTLDTKPGGSWARSSSGRKSAETCAVSRPLIPFVRTSPTPREDCAGPWTSPLPPC